jgi:hypothetical protein
VRAVAGDALGGGAPVRDPPAETHHVHPGVNLLQHDPQQLALHQRPPLEIRTETPRPRNSLACQSENPEWHPSSLVLAAAVAACNGLSSAQLAALHPVSAGTYEYGYRELGPAIGFTAGWMFLCAKTASAATAALGCAGYLLTALGLEGAGGLRSGVAVAMVATLTAVVAGGILV